MLTISIFYADTILYPPEDESRYANLTHPPEPRFIWAAEYHAWELSVLVSHLLLLGRRNIHTDRGEAAIFVVIVQVVFESVYYVQRDFSCHHP